MPFFCVSRDSVKRHFYIYRVFGEDNRGENLNKKES